MLDTSLASTLVNGLLFFFDVTGNKQQCNLINTEVTQIKQHYLYFFTK